MSDLTIKKDIGEIQSKPRCIASFEWKISDYFSLPQEVDQVYESPAFQFLGIPWFLQIYPNGSTAQQSSGYVGLYLIKEESTHLKRQVCYKIGIKDRDGNELKSCNSDDFEKNRIDLGSIYFISQNNLYAEKDKIAANGTLTVFCVLHVSEDLQTNRTWEIMSTSVDKLTKDLRNMFDSGEDSDVTIIVKDQEFKAHKAILRTRSPVFYSMFAHDMSEKNTGVVTIIDCEPAAFMCFLVYLYSGKVQNLTKNIVFDLYRITDKYNSTELKEICVQCMIDTLSTETFCDVVSISLQYQLFALLEVATEFFAKNLKDIIVSVQWQNFLKINPLAANELHIKTLKYYTFPE